MGDGGDHPVNDASAAVQLSAITKRFGDVVAVDNVDLEIADGEFFALLGPSGCGKTTTLRMVAGLEFPTEGSLKIFGNEVGTLPPNKRPVNTVFQDYALFPHMTVEANVAFGLKMQRVAKAEIAGRVQEAIGLVRLEGLEQRRSQQLSGGQRQRVALARALVNRPKVLLLDEPLGALDLKLRQEMQRELKALQREVGITFVFVTHDQEEALTMADRIGVMNEGELLQVGTPEGIYERPVNRFVANFIGQSNLIDASVVSGDTVCLADGNHIPGRSDLPVGTRVALCLRPERVEMHPVTAVPTGHTSISGRLESVTYLGNALVYTVANEWTDLEIRLENQPGGFRPYVGDDVAVSWMPDAVTVVRA